MLLYCTGSNFTAVKERSRNDDLAAASSSVISPCDDVSAATPVLSLRSQCQERLKNGNVHRLRDESALATKDLSCIEPNFELSFDAFDSDATSIETKETVSEVGQSKTAGASLDQLNCTGASFSQSNSASASLCQLRAGATSILRLSPANDIPRTSLSQSSTGVPMVPASVSQTSTSISLTPTTVPQAWSSDLNRSSLMALSREERLRISRLKQQQFRDKLAQKTTTSPAPAASGHGPDIMNASLSIGT